MKVKASHLRQAIKWIADRYLEVSFYGRDESGVYEAAVGEDGTGLFGIATSADPCEALVLAVAQARVVRAPGEGSP